MNLRRIGEHSLARFRNRSQAVAIAVHVSNRAAGAHEAAEERDAIALELIEETGDDLSLERLVRSFLIFDEERDAYGAAASLEALKHDTRIAGADLPPIVLYRQGSQMIGSSASIDTVAGEGPDRTLRAPDGLWMVIAERTCVFDREGLRRHRALLNRAAERHRGEYIGWEAHVYGRRGAPG